jgi:hypothetical protein
MYIERSNSILNHIITIPHIIITHTRSSFTIPIHTTLVVIILITAIITTLAIILITVAVLEAEEPRVVGGAAEDPEVVAGAEDVENLDRIRDPLWGEFEPIVSTKQGSTAGSEMTVVY